MKFKLIKANRSLYPVEKMCQILEVSKSGFRKWLTRGLSKRQQEDQLLLKHILAIFKQNRQSYGSPRMTGALRLLGFRVNQKRVERIMRENNVSAAAKKTFRPKTTDSSHKLAISPNLLRKNKPAAAGQIWVSDITYIMVGESWVYLCMIMDLFTREIVGYTLAEHMRASMVVETLQKAVSRYQPGQGLLFHSDRGVQYASGKFRRWLTHFGFEQSMSAKGYCYDNAAAESFFKSLKIEEVYRNRYVAFEEAASAIFDYIEIFYNKRRLHSSLGMMSPADFAAKHAA